ncbi:hypothetical protein KDX00_06525 [Cobetia amphilecti]|nr:hypothetical protein KDX00_06525 [Cobetia litoralis]
MVAVGRRDSVDHDGFGKRTLHPAWRCRQTIIVIGDEVDARYRGIVADRINGWSVVVPSVRQRSMATTALSEAVTAPSSLPEVAGGGPLR